MKKISNKFYLNNYLKRNVTMTISEKIQVAKLIMNNKDSSSIRAKLNKDRADYVDSIFENIIQKMPINTFEKFYQFCLKKNLDNKSKTDVEILYNYFMLDETIESGRDITLNNFYNQQKILSENFKEAFSDIDINNLSPRKANSTSENNTILENKEEIDPKVNSLE